MFLPDKIEFNMTILTHFKFEKPKIMMPSIIFSKCLNIINHNHVHSCMHEHTHAYMHAYICTHTNTQKVCNHRFQYLAFMKTAFQLAGISLCLVLFNLPMLFLLLSLQEFNRRIKHLRNFSVLLV